MKSIKYKGYLISVKDNISIWLGGKRINFPTVEEAREFIDDIEV